MIKQGRDLRSNESLTCDVVIVGSGAGGAPLAAELAMAGVDVVVLEKGAFVTAAQMTQDWGDMWKRIEGRRGFGSPRDFGVNLSYAETLGGSTVHYWACSFRPPHARIDAWNRDFGLGLDYERDLDPLLDRVENNLSVHRTHDYLFNANNRLIRLGTHLMRKRTGDERYRGENTPQAAKSCIGCGFREVGCAYNRKQSQLVSYLPMASRAGARILTDCDVREVIVEGGRAVGVRGNVRAPRDNASAGVGVEVRARQAVVVAGNGLTTPELLLRAGLTNSNLGHNLVVNPNVFIFARYPHAMNFRHGPPEAWWITGFAEPRYDASGRFVEGGWHAIPDLRDASTAAALIGFMGDELRERMELFPRLASAFSSIDDDSHFENKVTLDSNGDWQVDYRLRGDDPAKVRDYLEKICRIYFSAGFDRIYIPFGRTIDARPTYASTAQAIDELVEEIAAEPGDLAMSGAHLLGTARRGADPARAVCDPHGETYELPGLHVAGSAGLPGSVGLDPSITLIAVSTLMAKRFLQARGKQLVPLRWERTRKNHSQIVGGPKAARGYDTEQRRLASGKEVAVR